MDELIPIGKFSKISGVSTRTIRHYEDLGLLYCAAKTESNYRLYGTEEIKQLEKILLFKSLGFSLEDIKDILSTSENQKIVGIFEKRLLNLDREMSEIVRHKKILNAITSIYKSQGLDYVNNYHLMKEMIGVNSIFVKNFNTFDMKLQIKILMELYHSGSLTPETLKEIGTDSGTRLLKELHLTTIKVLLNRVDQDVEKNILQTLHQQDPEFAEEVKNAMFTFDDIAILSDATIVKWLTKCTDEELKIALFDSGKYIRNRILSNLSSERASQIQKSLKDLKVPSLDEIYVATTHLVDILRNMEVAGEITIERFN